MMTKVEVRARIQEIGIIPSVHVASTEDALFAAKEISAAGIPILEVATIEPGAIELIAVLVRSYPDLIVGGGELTDAQTAQRCLDAGAKFLTGPAVDLGGLEFSRETGPVIIPGALTPTEVITAWKSGCDLVKVFPCAEVGGAHYIRALKGPYPYMPLIASGGAVTTYTFAERGSSQDVEEGRALAPKFDADGLVTAVATDAASGDLLMVAHMNAEALARTIESGDAWYYSRSRRALWRKGETSGHTQRIVEMRIDCDQDAVWLKVEQGGPGACHTGRRSCFYRVWEDGQLVERP